MVKKIRFKVKHIGFRFVFVTDESEGTDCLSLTNGMEALVKNLSGKRGIIDDSTCLYYKDTDGRVDEVMHSEGKFVGFGAGFKNEEQFIQAYGITYFHPNCQTAEEVEYEGY